jgi:hypothetical protein
MSSEPLTEIRQQLGDAFSIAELRGPCFDLHIVNRNLAQVEWKLYMGDQPYRKTCPEWPEGT